MWNSFLLGIRWVDLDRWDCALQRIPNTKKMRTSLSSKIRVKKRNNQIHKPGLVKVSSALDTESRNDENCKILQNSSNKAEESNANTLIGKILFWIKSDI